MRELRSSVAALDQYFAAQIALVRQGTSGQLRAQLDVLTGKRQFDRFRIHADRLLARSDAIVASAKQSQRRTFRRTLALVVAVGLAIAGIGLALLIYLPEHLKALYDRERQARRLAERGDRASRALTHVADAVVLIDGQEVVPLLEPGRGQVDGPAGGGRTQPPCPRRAARPGGDRRRARGRRGRHRSRSAAGDMSRGSPPVRRGSPKAACSCCAT